MPLDGWGFRGGGVGNAKPFFARDALTQDSTGAFYVGQLERLDQTIHPPLVAYTWGRDIDLRTDVTTGDEIASFTNSSFAASGGMTPAGLSWIGKDVNAITGAMLDIGKTPQPLFMWGMELSYTEGELASAMQLGMPIDSQKYEVIQLKHQMDIDQCVYIGDSDLGTAGLLNHTLVTNVANVTGGTWAAAITALTPDVIVAQINEVLQSVWQASGWAVMPTELRVPPLQYGQLVSTKVSSAGNVALLRYIQQNSLCNTANGQELNIQPLKWLIGRGVGATQRMIAYTKDYQRVRFPLTPLQRTPVERRSLFYLTTYWGRIGVIEMVYPETIGYRDGI